MVKNFLRKLSVNYNFEIEDEKDPRGINTKVIIAFVVVIIIALVAFIFSRGILGQFRSGDKERFVASAIPELDQKPAKTLPNLKEGTTFLLIGSDKRWGSTEKWGRSDTILLVKISKESRAISLLSLPRDLLVPIPGYGEDKINAAYSYGGPGLLIATIREYLGVPINHFLQVSFDGFAEIIRGFPEKSVYIPVDARYYHSNEGVSPGAQYSEIDLKPGYQALRAEDALSFVRFRHLDSDFYRAARQQIFLREVARQVYAQSNGDIRSMQRFAQAVAKAGASDFSSLREALSLANTVRNIPPSRVLRLTVEGKSTIGSSGAYYIKPSSKELSSVLKLWNNPGLVLDKQKRAKPLDEKSRSALSYLEEIKSLALLFENEDLDKTISLLISKKKNSFTKKVSRVQRSPGETVSLVKQEESVVRPLTYSKKLKTCSPSELPAGYSWKDESRHQYKLAGRDALSLYASKNSGASILWMWTNWREAPILENPDDALRIAGRQYSLFWESGNLRMISWSKGTTQTWISNTLKNELTAEEMIRLAETCQY
jgi:LCP family protein required for cell wall assembly